MLKKILLLFILNAILITKNEADGKNCTNTKKTVWKSKHEQNIKNNIDVQREKRSFDNDDEFRPFWANRGKKQANEKIDLKNIDIDDNLDTKHREYNMDDNTYVDAPFWGNRGRRGEVAYLHNKIRDYVVQNRIDNPINLLYNTATSGKLCKHRCQNKYLDNLSRLVSIKNRREENSPFWGNRDRRNVNDDVADEDTDLVGPFWGNRGRRADDENPFWGARGRREDNSNRESKERGDDNLLFWGNRGRLDDSLPFWGNKGKREDIPFWGNRGRRENVPFWGNRGRRQDLGPFINARINKYGETKSKGLDDDSIFDLYTPNPLGYLWSNRGRDSTLKYLFGKNDRLRSSSPQPMNTFGRNKDFESIHDDRIYAEEPHFIVIDRSNEGFSTEEEPFFTSRGKKKIFHNLAKAARDRRGTIEDIVKSVKNDPYFIARGKKEYVQNFTVPGAILVKTKDLICSTIDLMNSKHEGVKVKREIDDSDKDRRTILKKLAAQLQTDPYFVSRGKKNPEITFNDVYLYEFIKKISEMCT
ncbi:Repetin [Eumeta japonica]|uniref:Repetin n=1 Tax=Eumeta variegata TaxID=151549 RepID=A0A4C1U738_EUMVA|nr:Repetin [Eumeta japonica]